MNLLRLLLCVVVFLFLGCFDSNVNTGSFALSSIYRGVSTGENERISLRNSIFEFDEGARSYNLSDITVLTEQCPFPSMSEEYLSFEVHSLTEKSCLYRYQISSLSENNKTKHKKSSYIHIYFSDDEKEKLDTLNINNILSATTVVDLNHVLSSQRNLVDIDIQGPPIIIGDLTVEVNEEENLVSIFGHSTGAGRVIYTIRDEINEAYTGYIDVVTRGVGDVFVTSSPRLTAIKSEKLVIDLNKSLRSLTQKGYRLESAFAINSLAIANKSNDSILFLSNYKGIYKVAYEMENQYNERAIGIISVEVF